MLIPDAEIARMKASVDIAALCASLDIRLKPVGKDLMGLCPFHDEKTPSFSVTPSTGLYHCFGCGQAGDIFSLLMKLDKIDFTEAYRKVAEFAGSTDSGRTGSHSTPHNGSHAPATSPEVDITLPETQEIIRSVLARYTENLKQSKEAQEYLKSRGLFAPLVIELGAGYSDGKLEDTLPLEHTEKGNAIREKLCAIGILRKKDSGYIERFRGSIVFPATEKGEITQIYGRRITKSVIDHMLLPLKHRGFFNEAALGFSEIVLCESAIDTFSLLLHGQTNACGVFGANGLNEAHAERLKNRGVTKATIAYDNDDAGNRGTQTAAELLLEHDIFAYRILFPENTDANDFIRTQADPRGTIIELIKQAAFMKPEESNEQKAPQASKNERADSSKKKATKRKGQILEAPGALTFDGSVAEFSRADRKYRIYNLARGTPGSLPVSVSLSHEGRYFLDKLELCSAKERDRFLDRISAQFELEREILDSDLNQLLYTLIRHKEEEQKNSLKPDTEEYQMTEEERLAAEELLKSPDLIDRITDDFEACGIAGEKTNLLCGYLAGTSRLLTIPLHVLFHSSSASGKSTLMNAVLSFMPDEVVIQYSALTGQVLFYMQSKDMKHKILAIAEDEGAMRAQYILKMLQTDGKASIASTITDPETGRHIGTEYKIEGPIAVFSTSTALHINEELQNRYLVLSADESIEQTRRIFASQRQFETEEALELTETRDRIRRIHKNAQRLLKPIRVINPFAKETKFPEKRARLRRDHGKYLALIRIITLLFQYQREKKIRETPHGREEYIEVTREDLELARRIAWPVFTRTLDEMPPHTRTFLERITELRSSEAKRLAVEPDTIRLTRRQMRDVSGLSSTQVHHHLSKLIDLEYVLPSSGGTGRFQTYEIIWDGELPGFFEEGEES
jgi:DNA primase catalytic core